MRKGPRRVGPWPRVSALSAQAARTPARRRAAPRPGGKTGGRPERALSADPAKPSATKRAARLRKCRTRRPTRRAVAAKLSPAAKSKTARARRTNPAGAFCCRVNAANCSCVASPTVFALPFFVLASGTLAPRETHFDPSVTATCTNLARTGRTQLRVVRDDGDKGDPRTTRPAGKR